MSRLKRGGKDLSEPPGQALLRNAGGVGRSWLVLLLAKMPSADAWLERIATGVTGDKFATEAAVC